MNLICKQMGIVMIKITKKHASLMVGIVVDQMLILLGAQNANALNEENRNTAILPLKPYKNKIISLSECINVHIIKRN